ncbi:MAG TPA: aminotransferase class V-fold PLP-dependent enzyme [Mycobacteriales bacterium]|jgi:kynureninase|nr:aminotransferase class V-fold PLP-dependent enzyme [Mycobacteriales bacterium]
MSAHDDLLARRADYPILASKTYLINNSLGAMHRGVHDGLRAYADLWETRGVEAWNEWLPEMTRVADLVGEVIGAPPGTVVMHQNVAALLAAVVSCFDFSGPRNRVVTTALDWPGSHYLWTEHGRYGADLVVVPSDDGIGVDAQRVRDAIDERTLVVSVSHVLFKSAFVMDVAPIVARAHEVGAVVVLDSYQAAGTLPFSVTDLDVDFCVGGSVKYLCGGPGNGWLYVSPRLAETLRPATVGWFGHARPFGFEWAAVEYAPGVARFAGGTPGVPAAYAAVPGYRAVLDVGIERIRERSLSLTQPLLEGALARGFTVRSPHDPVRRGGHVTIDPGDSERVHDELLRRGFVVDHRPGVGVRVGPHFYNSADECTAILDEMAAIRTGA